MLTMMLNKCLIVQMDLVKLYLITCILLFRIQNCFSFVPNDAEVYLQRFGYLPESLDGSANLIDENNFKDAIKQLQKNVNIPVTGIIDEKTREIMARPRCGRPDNPNDKDKHSIGHRHRRFVLEGSKWPRLQLKWSLVNQTMTKLDPGRVRAVLRDALDVWERGSQLKFQEVYDPKADIQVLFVGGSHGDGRDFDGPSGVLAHAFYPAEGRGGDAHFDDEEDWSLEESGHGTSLMDVAVHEFGHSIGLGHSSVESAIMYPWFYGEKKYKELPQDDRIAIEQLYGPVIKWGIYDRPVIKSTTTTTIAPRSYYPEPTKSREQLIEERRIRIQAAREQAEHEQKLKNEKKIQEESERRRLEKTRLDKERREREYQDYLNRKRNTKPTITTTKHSHRHRYRMDEPNMCNTTYDAVTMFRDEMYIFKGRYLWRIGRDGIYPGSPHEITQVWNISNDLTHVDAAYENKNGRMIFFVGKWIYSFNGHNLDRGYPKPLTAIGLPSALQKIDDIWIWGHNNQTFIFSGTKYWVFDEDTNTVVLDYPRVIKDFWTGIPNHIDAAFQYRNGITYFFKGKSFWQFNDKKKRSQYKKSESSAVKWMGCPPLTNTLSNEVTYDVETHQEGRTAALSSASNVFIDFTFWISISCLIFGKLFT